MTGEKKSWGIAFGERGSPNPDPVSEIMKADQADAARRRMQRKDEEESLEHEAKKKDLEKRISGEDEAEKAQLAQENEELKEKIHEKEVESVRVELGGKIDQLNQSVREGASQKSISQQIADIKQAAADMGLGGSKFSDVQEALEFVERLKPNKTLPEQLKDAQELMETFGKKETNQFPPEITLQLKQMDRDLQIRLEEMRDSRSDRDRDWQLQIRKWEEEKEIKMAQLQAEIAAKKEGNELLAQGIQRLGQVIAAAKGAAAGGVAGAVAGGVASGAGSRVINAGEGEAGEVECESCHSVIPISESADDVICPGCGTRYAIQRIPKTTEEAPAVEAGRRGKGK